MYINYLNLQNSWNNPFNSLIKMTYFQQGYEAKFDSQFHYNQTE